MGVLVIAETCSSWEMDKAKAFRLIEAAKQCGADVAKFQWTSGPEEMQKRRGVDPKYAEIYRKYITYPSAWLHEFKAHCDNVGIEFMCTVYLPQDIPVIAPLVRRFKVSAFESSWKEFVNAHPERETILSRKIGTSIYYRPHMRYLWCVSEYPTPLEHLKLCNLGGFAEGLSDHTTSTLTGAVAVGAGATIIEKHIRLYDTSPENPDYRHSLHVNELRDGAIIRTGDFGEYVKNIREAEKMIE